MITYRHLGTNGQLGNQLWQIAATIGIATRLGEQAGFPYWTYRPHFSLPDDYFPNLAGLRTHDLGRDFLQDLGLFEDVADRVRGYFAPPSGLQARLKRRHPRLFEHAKRTAVHVRRGDYLRHPALFRMLRMSYYEEAMSRCVPPFIVFSDDIEWCRERFPSECVFVAGNLAYEDLHLMSMCTDFVISNSTFAWWAAWLSARPTICPEHWFGPAMANVDQGRRIPSDWTLI